MVIRIWAARFILGRKSDATGRMKVEGMLGLNGKVGWELKYKFDHR